MYSKTPGRLISAITLSIFSLSANAEAYLCVDEAGANIDQYGISTSTDEGNDFEQQQWIVNTDKGWRRSDVSHFSGACEENKGYVVCKAHDIAFGEATFSIHPNGSNFVLAYIDYGLGALAFVGKCRKS